MQIMIREDCGSIFKNAMEAFFFSWTKVEICSQTCEWSCTTHIITSCTSWSTWRGIPIDPERA